MKFITWNVNGLQRRVKSGFFYDVIRDFDPDVIFIQETRCTTIDFIDEINDVYDFYINPNKKSRGFHGTGILIKKNYKIKIKSIVLSGHSDEGRIMKMIYNDICFINCYTPNAGVDRHNPLKNLNYRVEKWDVSFNKYIQQQQKKYKYIVICGDLNVAVHDYDVHNPKHLHHSAGFTDEERHSFSEIVKERKLIDVFDYYKPYAKGENRFTFYSPFHLDKGWRLDYVLCWPSVFVDSIKILRKYYSSDHIPILFTIK